MKFTDTIQGMLLRQLLSERGKVGISGARWSKSMEPNSFRLERSSKFIFKRKSRGFLFDTLLDMDDYVEVDV